MKGNPKVIAELNKALREELTAINQYFLHAEMCENWKYHRLAEYIKKQSIGEMKHAEVLIERILFLDGTPSMQPLELKVSRTVKGMLESDLSLEVSAVKQYNDAVQIATKEGDNGSRDLLVQLLKDEESHVDWLEAQLHQIDELGYERYLTQQVGDNTKKTKAHGPAGEGQNQVALLTDWLGLPQICHFFCAGPLSGRREIVLM